MKSIEEFRADFDRARARAEARSGGAAAAPGLGDAVAAVTKRAGIQPCGACSKRQAAMNRATPAWARRMLGWWSRHFGVP